MVVSGGAQVAVKQFLGALLGVRVVARHDKYLGLPALGVDHAKYYSKILEIGSGIG
ncbi:UNVERIFIED_CONTAM: hypothetical protein Slati_3494600 [Sesamum latifolium]|uniref:Uncharacterized protein n=1 Tax=Sesamum latifolium TaxID=2727402 RepID=A0AAW2UJU2_9LAMI